METKRPYHHIVTRVRQWKLEGRELDDILAFLTKEAIDEGATQGDRLSRIRNARKVYNAIH